MWGLIVALASGALMSIQGVFNTEVTKQTSVWVSAGWVQASAFLTCVVFWLLSGRDRIGGLMQVTPKYMSSYYLHSDQEHERSGSGEGCTSHCGGPDPCGVWDRGAGTVRRGQGRI